MGNQDCKLEDEDRETREKGVGILQKNVESCNIGNRGQEPGEGRKKERKLKIRREGERIQEEVEVQGIRVIMQV